MKNLIIILIFLPTVLFAAHINWDLLDVKELKNYEKNYKVFPLPDKEITYMFWTDRDTSTNDRTLCFQIRFKNRTYTSPHVFATRFADTDEETSYSVQVSLDGKHILLAYNEYRDDEIHNDAGASYHVEIFFCESTNGGETWSQPFSIIEGTFNYRYYVMNPSMIFEEDINRVSVGFVFKASSDENKLGLAVKESGSTKFIQKTIDIGGKYLSSLYLAITLNRATSKRYLHVIWDRFDDFYYTKSEDDGKTWTVSKLIAKSSGNTGTKSVVVNDYNAFGSGIFVQYYYNQDIRIVYTNNHGELWLSTRVGSDIKGRHSVCVCGSNEKGRLISLNGRVKLGNGFVRYQQPYQRFFTNAEYPFGLTYEIDKVAINCRYDGKGKYAVSALVLQANPSRANIVYGTMNES